MKYHIDTIPVWDALKEESECPLCALRRKTERLLVERSLGGAVMSPDARQKSNAAGFCAKHQQEMFHLPQGNRLGQALMLLSHLQHIRPQIEKELKSTGGQKPAGLFKSLARKGTDGSQNPTGLAKFSSRCLLCEELEDQAQRQTASLLHLWKTDAAFREAFLQSKGLCLADTDRALQMSGQMLSGSNRDSFQQAARDLLILNLQRLEEELDFYTQKFDYRNAQQPWGNSKDALERGVNKLRGWCLGNEPMQDSK